MPRSLTPPDPSHPPHTHTHTFRPWKLRLSLYSQTTPGHTNTLTHTHTQTHTQWPWNKTRNTFSRTEDMHSFTQARSHSTQLTGWTCFLMAATRKNDLASIPGRLCGEEKDEGAVKILLKRSIKLGSGKERVKGLGMKDSRDEFNVTLKWYRCGRSEGVRRQLQETRPDSCLYWACECEFAHENVRLEGQMGGWAYVMVNERRIVRKRMKVMRWKSGKRDDLAHGKTLNIIR